jgi:hypothetical protein
MVTRELVSNQLLRYLNGEIGLAQLVGWAEDQVGLGDFHPEADVDLLMDILMYLAAADTAYFALTWEVCQEFMKQLGTPIKAVRV